jgi:replicative DNA helicase
MIDLNMESQTIAGMLNNQECLDIGVADLKEEWIFDSFYRQVFKTIKGMYLDSKPVTASSVYKEMGEITKQRGTSWLLLKEAFFRKSDLEYNIQKLNELYKTRELVKLSENIIRRADQKENVSELLKDMENSLYSLTVSAGQEKIISPKECANRMLNTLEKRMEKKQDKAISTSYEMLNYAINGGFRPEQGQLVIIAAKTGKGKTAYAMNLMRDIAVVQKQESLYINTEMSDEQMDCRWMTIATPDIDITHSKIATGELTDAEQTKVMGSMEKIYQSGFNCINVPDLNMTKLISIAKRFKSQNKMKVMVVDYIGRMDTTDAKMPEHLVLKNIAKKMKTLAQELKITIIMLAQLNDDEKLEGAKAMKNETDLFAYLREAQGNELLDIAPYNYFLIIDKNRDGKSMKLRLKFVGDKLTFVGEKYSEVVARRN